MNAKDYEFLVYRLEAASRENPASFRVSVALVSGLAYTVLALFLAALGLLFYFLLDTAQSGNRTYRLIQIILFSATLLPIFWVTLRALLTRLEPPNGRALTRNEAPKLFDLLDRIRAKLNAPQLHMVILDDRYNAAICQVPRFGLFGGHRNYLIIGLPYLLGTPKMEAVATLAHEYGHLAGDHGKMGTWVYRQRTTFSAIHAKVSANAENNVVNAILAGALNRFAPYFNAYTFVLSRQQEYEADATASRLAGTEPNASGLVRDNLLGSWIAESFWPKLYAQADTSNRPRFLPYAAMRTAFSAAHGEWATQERLKAALKTDSGLEDTHPCLRERLEAINGQATLPEPIERSAAESLLGASTKKLIEEFDQQWWEANRAGWQSHHQRLLANAERLADLTCRPLPDLSPFDLQELATLQTERGDRDAALTVLNHLLQRPGGPYPRAELLKGRHLLTVGDRRGLDNLLTARADDCRLEEDCLRIGYGFLEETEGIEAAEEWVNRALAEKSD